MNVRRNAGLLICNSGSRKPQGGYLSPLFYLYMIEKNPTTARPPKYKKQNDNCYRNNAE
jgi:hypothetical protein